MRRSLLPALAVLGLLPLFVACGDNAPAAPGKQDQCGAGGTTCPSGFVCESNACHGTAGTACSDTAPCATGLTCVDGSCHVPPAPQLLGLDPWHGPLAGGTVVTLSGTGFRQGSKVLFGGTESGTVTFVSATELTAAAPAHAAGPVDVEVVAPSGESTLLPGGFVYGTEAPGGVSIASVLPASGPVAGGTRGVITGSGFQQGAKVFFGGMAVASLKVVDERRIVFTTAASRAGAVDVIVLNPDEQVARLAKAFSFYEGAGAAPSLTGVVPSRVARGDTSPVEAVGENFGEHATAFVADEPVEVTSSANTRVGFHVPAVLEPGTYDVTVTTGEGRTVTLTGGLEVLAPDCHDGVTNGSESDKDCGGTCDACADGKTCRAPADCTSGSCEGGVCRAAACDDELKNGTESDVDCGGSCPKCGIGGKCGGNTDCATGLACTDGVCTDIDECQTDNGGCDSHTTCTNIDGGRTCGACPTGFSGTGEAGCTDIDECTAGGNNCSANAKCQNTSGSFTCTCKAGYTGNGVTCTKILCGPGKYSVNGACQPVGPGYWSPDQDDNRYPCEAGYFCASGVNSTSQGDGPCAAGYSCPEGSSSDTGAGMCGANTYAPAGSASCLDCPFNSSATGLTDADHDGIDDCKGNGGWWNCQSGSCSLAGAGYYSPPGDNNRYPCAAGHYCSTSANATANGNGTCTAGYSCPEGSTSATGSGMCGANTYAPAGSGSCLACPAHSTTTGTNATDHDALTDCRTDPGYYNCQSGTCQEAGAGYYAPGDDKRYACGTAYFSSSTTASACSVCTNQPQYATTVIYASSTALTSNSCPYQSVVCGSPREWTGTACQDQTPDAFSFTNVTNADPATTVTSNTITPTGFDGPLTLACTGCTGLVRNGTLGGTSVSGVQAGDTIAVQATSPVSGQTINIQVSLGKTSTTWTVTSRDLTAYQWKVSDYNSSISPSDATTWSWGIAASGNSSSVRTGAPLTGKVYAEFKSVARPGSNLPIAFGITGATLNVYYNSGRYAMVSGSGSCGTASGTGYSANGGFTSDSRYAFGQDDVISVAVDATAGKIWYAKNGVWITGDPAAGTNPTSTFAPGTWYFYASSYSCYVSSGTLIDKIYPSGGAYPTPAGFSTYQ